MLTDHVFKRGDIEINDLALFKFVQTIEAQNDDSLIQL